MKIKPLGKRVLVRRSEAQTSKGGIILPDSAQEKPRQGEVVAVGPGAVDENGRLQPLSVKVGDRVLFSNYGGNEVKDQEGLLLLKEDDILGILE
ncbi:MAG: co-chaperone GroES [Verrucomicrobia bacterium]|nr:co-chaperone GroES [Verrucomicrobiota bacterium]